MRRFISFFFTAALFAACEPRIVAPDPGPDNPEPEPPVVHGFDVKVTAADGVMGKNGPVSMPEFTLVIEGPEAMYTVEYTFDDKSGTLKEVWPGDVRKFTVTDADGVSEHKLYGQVTRDATGESVSFNAAAWLRWPPLSEAKAAFSTTTAGPVPFSAEPITVDRNLQITVSVDYKDADTPVEAVACNHSSVSVKSFGKAENGHASMVVIPSAKTDDGWFGMVLVNGNLRDTLVQRFVCTGEEAQGQTVTDFSIEGFEGSAVSVPMKTSLPFTVHPDPANAVDAGEVSVTSGDEKVFTVSRTETGWTVLPVWPGAASMTVTAGKVRKEYTVTVTGTPVSDFRIGGAFSATQWITGTEVSDLIIPEPADAFDADEMTVTSLNPDIITVTADAGGRYTLRAAAYGKAVIEIATGHCSKKMEITVREDLDLSAFGRTSIPWGESVSYRVDGHFSDFFIDGAQDSDIELVRSGNTVTVTSMIHKSLSANRRSGKSVELSFKAGDGTVYKTTVKLAGVENTVTKSLSVNVKEKATELVFRFKNGTDYALSYETMEGYVMSTAGEGMNTIDFYEKLEHGRFGMDFCDSYGKLYGRFYDFLRAFSGEADYDLYVPEMDIAEFRMTVNYTGDDFGSYKKGVSVYIRANKGINPNNMEEWYLP